MSDVAQGPGWWQASDGKWNPPELHPSYVRPVAPPRSPPQSVQELAAYEGLPPGWYRDSSNRSLARYWDGTTLSEERRQVATSTTTPPPATSLSDLQRGSHACSGGPDWWLASDGKWYPPERHPDDAKPVAPPPPPQNVEAGASATSSLLAQEQELAAYRGLAPGWYRDQADPAVGRYWDGTKLSEERRPITPSPSPSCSSVRDVPQQPGERGAAAFAVVSSRPTTTASEDAIDQRTNGSWVRHGISGHWYQRPIVLGAIVGVAVLAVVGGAILLTTSLRTPKSSSTSAPSTTSALRSAFLVASRRYDTEVRLVKRVTKPTEQWASMARVDATFAKAIEQLHFPQPMATASARLAAAYLKESADASAVSAAYANGETTTEATDTRYLTEDQTTTAADEGVVLHDLGFPPAATSTSTSP